MSWKSLNPLQRAKKPEGAGKAYIGADPLQPHAGLAVFSEVQPDGASFCVEGRAADLKADLCGKLLDWPNMPPHYLASLKTGGTVTLSLDKLKTLIR